MCFNPSYSLILYELLYSRQKLVSHRTVLRRLSFLLDRNWWGFCRQAFCNCSSTEGSWFQAASQTGYMLCELKDCGDFQSLHQTVISVTRYPSLCVWSSFTPAAKFLGRQKSLPNFIYIILLTAALCRLEAHTSHDL